MADGNSASVGPRLTEMHSFLRGERRVMNAKKLLLVLAFLSVHMCMHTHIHIDIDTRVDIYTQHTHIHKN